MDFCKYVMSINGVLKDQVTTYATTKDTMVDSLGTAGNDITTALTYDSYVKVATPLKG